MIAEHANASTEDLAATFDRDGVVCVRQLIASEWIERLREAVEGSLQTDEIKADVGARVGKPGMFVGGGQLWPRHPRLKSFFYESPLAEVAATIMRSSKVQFYNDGMFVKEPGADVRTPWHQDLPATQFSGMQTCSAWVALDDVTSDTGALNWIASSHKLGLFAGVELGSGVVRAHREGDDMAPIPDFDAELERYRVVSYDMQPGDVTFHNLLTVHGAGENRSLTHRRRAFVLRMFGDDVVGCDRLAVRSRLDANVREGEPLNDHDFPILWSRSDMDGRPLAGVLA